MAILLDNCAGCDNLFDVEQVHQWEKDGTTRISPPTKTMEPYCRHYALHMAYVVQMQMPNDCECMFWHEYQTG